MYKNESNDNLNRERSELKALTREKAGTGNFIDDILIAFSGANPIIAKVLPVNEKEILLLIGGVNICFLIITLTGVGYVLFFSLEEWMAVIFWVIIAVIFNYCLRVSFSVRRLHLKNQSRLLLIIQRFVLVLCLIVSLAGIALWIFSKRINQLARHSYYEKEYNNYRNELIQLGANNTDIANSKQFTIADELSTIRQTKKLIQINKGLDQKKRELLYPIGEPHIAHALIG